MKKIHSIITQVSVGPPEESPIFGKGIRIRLEDEGGGMFLVLEQETAEIRIDFDEWYAIREAVQMLMGQSLVK